MLFIHLQQVLDDPLASLGWSGRGGMGWSRGRDGTLKTAIALSLFEGVTAGCLAEHPCGCQSADLTPLLSCRLFRYPQCKEGGNAGPRGRRCPFF